MSFLYYSPIQRNLPGRVFIFVVLGFIFLTSPVWAGPVPDGPSQSEHLTSVEVISTTTPTIRFVDPAYSENAPGQGGNPFPNNLPETFSTPTLVDLDNDGDLDMVSGDEQGNFLYFQNTGSAASPSYLQMTDSDNPLDGENIAEGKTAPAFVDIDNDGDFDMIAGAELGGFFFYENTGDAANPAFSAVTGAGNPLDGVDIGDRSAPIFADLDGDGDFDMVAGGFAGALLYFENTGDASSATFSQQSGAGNPFSGIVVTSLSKPALGDVDADGDLDLVVGLDDGTLAYYENDGANMFTQVTGADNPFDGFDAGTESAPAISDVTDGNGVDVVVGNVSGDFYYYVNADPLPVELTSFEAILDGSDVVLRWSTASETNNAGFEVQQHVDGAFQRVGWVDGAGTTVDAQSYSFTVPGVGHGTHTYRLMQVDFDGAFEYSDESAVLRTLEAAYEMEEPYPNPFNPQATFTLTVAQDQQVTVAVYDMQGKMVGLLHSGALKGQQAHQFVIDGSVWASGNYLIRAVGESFNTAQVITLLK